MKALAVMGKGILYFATIVIVYFCMVQMPFSALAKLRSFHDPNVENFLMVLFGGWATVGITVKIAYESSKPKPLIGSILSLWLWSACFLIGTLWMTTEHLSKIETWEGMCDYAGPISYPRSSRGPAFGVVINCDGKQYADVDNVMYESIGKIPRRIQCKVFAAGNHECTVE